MFPYSFVRPVFHFNRTVPKRGVFLCLVSFQAELMTLGQEKTLRFGTVRLEWKTGLRLGSLCCAKDFPVAQFFRLFSCGRAILATQFPRTHNRRQNNEKTTAKGLLSAKKAWGRGTRPRNLSRLAAQNGGQNSISAVKYNDNHRD